MKPWNSTSLRKRLTWRMVAMQALVLLAFTSVAAFPIYMLVKDDQGLDAGIIDAIGESIRRNAVGGLELAIDSEVQEEKTEDYPNLWFYAVDA